MFFSVLFYPEVYIVNFEMKGYVTDWIGFEGCTMSASLARTHINQSKWIYITIIVFQILFSLNIPAEFQIVNYVSLSASQKLKYHYLLYSASNRVPLAVLLI